MTTPIEKLREYGYELPRPKPPVASYVPVVRTGNILYVSGQISSSEEGVVQGRLGDNMNVVQGGNAAELAAVKILAEIVHSGGVELTGIKRVLKLTVLVASAPEFFEQHLVASAIVKRQSFREAADVSNREIHPLGAGRRHNMRAITSQKQPAILHRFDDE